MVSKIVHIKLVVTEIYSFHFERVIFEQGTCEKGLERLTLVLFAEKEAHRVSVSAFIIGLSLYLKLNYCF